ncbi:MAG: pentapeptide repeat-containing protein, partial [Pseudomonadota bacterium]
MRANKINLEGATLINSDLQEAKLYNSNLANADFTGTLKRYTIWQDAVMDGCKGCPHNWQTGEPIWEFENRVKQERAK